MSFKHLNPDIMVEGKFDEDLHEDILMETVDQMIDEDEEIDKEILQGRGEGEIIDIIDDEEEDDDVDDDDYDEDYEDEDYDDDEDDDDEDDDEDDDDEEDEKCEKCGKNPCVCDDEDDYDEEDNDDDDDDEEEYKD